jgi:hypothetical protein
VVVVAIMVAIVAAIMVVLVPVTLSAPAMSVFIPPTVVMAPAKLSGFVQFGAGTVGLRAMPAVMFGGFVKPMIRPDDALLAVVFIGHGAGASGKKHKSGKRDRGHNGCSTQFDNPSQNNSHQFFLLRPPR